VVKLCVEIATGEEYAVKIIHKGHLEDTRKANQVRVYVLLALNLYSRGHLENKRKGNHVCVYFFFTVKIYTRPNGPIRYLIALKILHTGHLQKKIEDKGQMDQSGI